MTPPRRAHRVVVSSCSCGQLHIELYSVSGELFAEAILDARNAVRFAASSQAAAMHVDRMQRESSTGDAVPCTRH